MAVDNRPKNDGCCEVTSIRHTSLTMVIMKMARLK
uniref:Uncharacterized protein n=1 Tax=Nelumbo nucifera TaxID=4432 RepID=A0A822XX11_NELNU|nr:TPA_asm: hypothetical protein HUJ06_025019 [Nelumbo nucifera]